MNNDVFGHDWNDSPIIFTSDQKLIIDSNQYIILFLTCMSGAKKREIDENSHRSIAAPLLFFYFKYIYTRYNQSVKLFYLGTLSKT